MAEIEKNANESFEDMAIKTEPFESKFNKEELRKYIEKSIEESRKADAEAKRSAANIRLF